MYIIGFLVIWGLVVWRVRHNETDLSLDVVWDIVVVVFLGSIVGGRLGFVLLYGDNEFSILGVFRAFFPINPATGEWVGWYGMSFFGALVGAIIFGWLGTRWKKITFLRFADFVVVAIPLGYMFGRIGNFLNGELFGKETTSIFGVMVRGVMRHPSQLYEAILEGGVLFIVLWSIRKKTFFPGAMLAFFGMGYAVMRFVAEYFRNEPLFFSCWVWELTQGQLYASVLFVAAVLFYWWRRKKYDRINKQDKIEV